MTQAHSILLKDFDFENIHLLNETNLPSTTLRHIKALRINISEELHFMNGKGAFFITNCTSTRPYIFTKQSQFIKKKLSPFFHLYLSAPRKDSLGQTLAQATEMGVLKISFLKTDHNDIADKEHSKTLERSQRVLEASVEQCRAPYLPVLNDKILRIDDIPKDAIVFFADENLAHNNLMGCADPAQLANEIINFAAKEWILLVGPEGGWSNQERTKLTQRPHTLSLGLGAQILRVPTACVAALTLLQNYRTQHSQQIVPQVPDPQSH